jgi:hypothetical protein
MANRAKSNPKSNSSRDQQSQILRAQNLHSQDMRRLRRNQIIFAVISLIMIISMLISLVRF